MSYTYGTKGAPAVGGGLPGLPTRGDNDIGTIKAFDVYPGPDWLPCDGAQYSRADYPLLAEKIGGLRSNVLSTISTIPGSFSPYAIATDQKGTWIVGGTSAKTAISRDNGWSWSVLDLSSILGTTFGIYGIDTDGNGTWAVGGNGTNIAVSRDNGYTWSSLTVGYQVSNIKTDKNGTWVLTPNSATTTKRSTDNLNSLSNTGLGVQIQIFNGLDTDGKGAWVACTTSATMARSADNGATWSSITAPAVNVRGLSTDGNGNWLACTSDTSAQLVYSNNNGAGFYLVNAGFQNLASEIYETAYGGSFGWIAVRDAGDIRMAANGSDISSGKVFSSVPTKSIYTPIHSTLRIVASDKRGTWVTMLESSYALSNAIDPAKFVTPSYGWPSTNQYIKAR